jgi:hypothetical protein
MLSQHRNSSGFPTSVTHPYWIGADGTPLTRPPRIGPRCCQVDRKCQFVTGSDSRTQTRSKRSSVVGSRLPNSKLSSVRQYIPVPE